jgi:hypothetical protein
MSLWDTLNEYAWAIYGVMVLGVLLLNSYAAANDKPRHVDAWGVSLLLFMSYCVSNMAVGLLGWPETMAVFPLIDIGVAFMIYVNWRRHPRPWKMIVMAALLLQLVGHVVATGMWKTESLTYGGMYLYAVLLNALFVIQLLAVGGVGVAYVLGRILNTRPDRRRVLVRKDA